MQSTLDMTRSISLAALTVLELTPPEMVICAAEAGFSHVGIRLLLLQSRAIRERGSLGVVEVRLGGHLALG